MYCRFVATAAEKTIDWNVKQSASGFLPVSIYPLTLLLKCSLKIGPNGAKISLS